MFQLSVKTRNSCIAYHKHMIVILQGTEQYTDGYNIHQHQNCVRHSKEKLKYIKDRINENQELLKDLTLAQDTKHDW